MAHRDAVIAAQRFGFGASPEDLRGIARDAKDWLLAQLRPEARLPAPLSALPTTLDDQLAFFRWIRERRAASMDPDGSRTDPVERSFARALLPRYRTAVKARFDAAVGTPTPFFERLVHFWSNHFTVSGVKPAAIALPPSFERDAIRPHVMGRFVDMLSAVAKHPAMLVYLDNVQSIGPGSQLATAASRRAAARRTRGLNENLAREILELHTVGANGGYTQADVTSFAKIITGWQVLPPRQLAQLASGRSPANGGSGLFYFNARAHEPGTHVVMGESYTKHGVGQGEAVLRDLARHPSTATHIATKLARHFIADDPPRAAIERLARAFTESDGDLAATSKALVTARESWEDVRPKLKRPEEYLVSAVRSFGGPPLDENRLLVSLSEMGQRPYMAPGPDGWSDQQDLWLSPDGIWKRLEWAELASRALAPAIPSPADYLHALFGETLSRETRTAVARAESPAQGLTLALAAPEFMRR